MAIKRRGIVAVPGEYKYGDVVEIKTAEELRAAAERQPIIMLTKGHPLDGVPSAKDVIGTVSQKWNEELGKVTGEFWFHDEKVPESIRVKIVNNEPVAISPGFMVDGIENNVQTGIVYTHMAVLEEEDPRCPLGACGVNVRLDSKDGTVRSLRLDQKTELAPVPKTTPVPEEPKIAEQKPVAAEEPPKTEAPAEQKPEVVTKTEVVEPVKEPAKEVPLVPEVAIPVSQPVSGKDYAMEDGWVKYVPRPYRIKEETK